MSIEHIKAAASTTVADDSVDTDAIADDAVTYAKIQNVSATNRILGRDSSGAGVVEEITPANVVTMLGIEASATADQTSGEILTLLEDGIDSVHYKDNSVDAVHLFDLARGSLLIGNASAATAELTKGGANEVLTSDGTDIAWGSVPSPSGAQTGITTILNTSTKIGRDTENLIDFATTDNKIILRVNNVNEVELVENALTPTTNDGVALGTTSLGWSDAHLAAQGVINWANGEMTITETSANLLTIAGGAVTATAASLSFDSGVADENVSGITAYFETGEDMVRGAVAYFKASDSKMWQVDADAAATMPVVAMAAEDIDVSTEATGLFLLQGFCHDAGSFPTWTIGGKIYASTTPGVPTQTAPSGDGDFVQVLGWAVSGDAVYFNPSEDVIEHA